MNRVFDQALMAYNKETKKLDDLYRSAAKNCGMAECAFWILYTLRVEDDIAIAPFRAAHEDALAARHLTRHLHDYFLVET